MEKRSPKYVLLKDAQLARHRAGSEPTTLSLGKWAEVTFKPWRPTALILVTIYWIVLCAKEWAGCFMGFISFGFTMILWGGHIILISQRNLKPRMVVTWLKLQPGSDSKAWVPDWYFTMPFHVQFQTNKTTTFLEECIIFIVQQSLLMLHVIPRKFSVCQLCRETI